MNIRLYKEDLFFMAFSIFTLGLAVSMGHDAFDWNLLQEQLGLVINFIAGEVPHTY